MAARVYRLGTIYSRIDGLIRKGHVKEKDKPIWFDVYRSFPPKFEPTFKRTVPEITTKEIFYEEDHLRARIHKALGDHLGLFKLNGKENLLKSYQQYISEGCTEDEAIEKLKNLSRLQLQKPDTVKPKSDKVLDEIFNK